MVNALLRHYVDKIKSPKFYLLRIVDMADYYVYSTEEMPRTDLFMKRDYNADNDWIKFNGIHIGVVPAKTWTKVPDRTRSLRHLDRSDKQGHTYHVFDDEIVKANRERLGPRGVIFLDHAPTAAEKSTLEAESEKRNLAFRLQAIQSYEEANREAEVNGRVAKASSYVLECYELLGMERPGSVEALRAQRQPGEAAAERFADAISKSLGSIIEKLLAAQAKPEPKPSKVI